MKRSMVSRWLLISFSLMMVSLGCQKKEPVRIGFMGGLTGKVADLGIAGRNGAQLAVEQRNAAGGINGAPVELVVRDDEQNPEVARKAVAELTGQKLEVIIGPMTSSMAMAVMPQINASKSILLSPTVTTTDLRGKDDNFIRVCSVTTDYATKSARYQYEKLGTRTIAVIYDIGNKSYTESWLADFEKTFTALGGRITRARNFQSGRETVFQPLVKDLLATKPDAVLIISNAVDSALIVQQVHALAPKQRVCMSEWASTERFIELAGTASEGMVVSQFLDRNNRTQRYLDFLAAYRARFSQEPGFAGISGYDAALVAMEAHALRTPGDSIKSTILKKNSFDGVQQTISIDRFGDSSRNTFVTTIKDGQYHTVE